MVATTNQKARLLDLTTSVLELTRDGARDINEVVNVLQVMKDDPQFAEHFSPNKILWNNGDKSVFTVLCDNEKTVAELIRLGKYHNDAGREINDELFPIPVHLPMARAIEYVVLDRGMIAEEILAEFASRGLKRPTYKDCLLFGIKYPDEQTKYSLYFFDEAIQGKSLIYPSHLLYLTLSANTRETRFLYIASYGPQKVWDKGSIFPGIRE
ncbi:MAG: hypothetical protein HYY92_01115 [Parcubacteria group bacterium]|nr:hypothetical protein [Parcubacteria group bacterium]